MYPTAPISPTVVLIPATDGTAPPESPEPAPKHAGLPPETAREVAFWLAWGPHTVRCWTTADARRWARNLHKRTGRAVIAVGDRQHGYAVHIASAA